MQCQKMLQQLKHIKISHYFHKDRNEENLFRLLLLQMRRVHVASLLFLWCVLAANVPTTEGEWTHDDVMACKHMMTSSNGNIFRVTGPLCREVPDHRWIPRTQRPVTRSFGVSLICAWIHGWVNNPEAGDLRRHRAHYDVTVMDPHIAGPLRVIHWLPVGFPNHKGLCNSDVSFVVFIVVGPNKLFNKQQVGGDLRRNDVNVTSLYWTSPGRSTCLE